MVTAFFRTLICTAALLGLSLSTATANELNHKNPYVLVQQVSELTFARFERDRQLIETNPDHLKVIVEEELMPYIDSQYSAYKVLGKFLRQTNRAQRDAFVEAFSSYLVTTYAQAFTEYTNQTVSFEPAQDFSGESIVSVGVNIIEPGRPDIKIQFKARRLKNDTWKAFDMVAEGVSLLASKQSQIAAMIRQQGIDQVTITLAEKGQSKVQPRDQKDPS
ncbi:MlaC/ttg2D family ABC transporter substrate-binding protein [Paraferrimonas sedimenticola]|uniref:Toluene tolerance protein n=1 Tax=Paraferrimonas sedimenticola TaxID=375674 RepID=A0AA37RV79_9GAMM|nr:ABC transporter substrate-binding protein [Paraferrimonas sedimenticola]GLP95821.1 toluene tolerance protein [Paraferrimonas sedimenticola]